MPMFYTDDPVADFAHWDAWCEHENQRIRYEQEQEQEEEQADEQ